MAFAEKLYALRKRSGLSQEQLAEQLNVSRQAISKWERGQSLPESEKLISISEYFHISLDERVMEKPSPSDSSEAKGEDQPIQKSNLKKWITGMITCTGGLVSLILWGIISMSALSAAKQLSGSSMIEIDGSGIFLILCLAFIIVGAAMLLRNTSNQ